MTIWDEVQEMIETRLREIVRDAKYANLSDESIYLATDIRAKLEHR